MAKTKVRLLVALAGPAGAWQAGDTYECSDDEAERLIERGFAEPVTAQKGSEDHKKKARR
jgi:hypothetical protein